MRFHERAANLQWKKGTKRPDKSNAIDMLCSGQTPKTDVEKKDYEKNFEVIPEPFSQSERDQWISQLNNVVVSSDAFCKYSQVLPSLLRSGPGAPKPEIWTSEQG